MPARIDDLLVLNANLNKTDFAKYLRDREAVLPSDFGGLGDGVARRPHRHPGRLRSGRRGWQVRRHPARHLERLRRRHASAGGARGLIMQGVIRYTGTAAGHGADAGQRRHHPQRREALRRACR